MEHNWFKDYFNLYKGLHINNEVLEKLTELKNLIEEKSRKNKIYIFGNGGSAAMASHVAVDFSKNAQTNMMTFNEYDHITCLSNDYGYEYWMEKAIEI